MDSSNMEDLRLPNAVVTRLIKDAIPAGVNVSKEARTAIARSAAIFVVHATAYANEYAVAHKRKNVTAADVFHAIKALECDELEKPMAEAMETFKVQHEQRKKRKRAQAAHRSSGKATATPSAGSKSQDKDGNGDASSSPSPSESEDETAEQPTHETITVE